MSKVGRGKLHTRTAIPPMTWYGILSPSRTRTRSCRIGTRGCCIFCRLQGAEALRDPAVPFLVRSPQVLQAATELIRRQLLHLRPGGVHQLHLELPPFSGGHLPEGLKLRAAHHTP